MKGTLDNPIIEWDKESKKKGKKILKKLKMIPNNIEV